jgi:hypothetical protein
VVDHARIAPGLDRTRSVRCARRQGAAPPNWAPTRHSSIPRQARRTAPPRGSRRARGARDLTLHLDAHERPVARPDRARTIATAHEPGGVPYEPSNYSKLRSTPSPGAPKRPSGLADPAAKRAHSLTCAVRPNPRRARTETRALEAVRADPREAAAPGDPRTRGGPRRPARGGGARRPAHWRRSAQTRARRRRPETRALEAVRADPREAAAHGDPRERGQLPRRPRVGVAHDDVEDAARPYDKRATARRRRPCAPGAAGTSSVRAAARPSAGGSASGRRPAHTARLESS